MQLPSTASGQPIEALIFDMDGTMIDSMPWHRKSWLPFLAEHGIVLDMDDLMRKTTGRTGIECMEVVFQRTMDAAEAAAYVHKKESIYRELFDPVFAEVAGFTAFYGQAHARGFKLGVGTAGDRHNQAFAYARLKLPTPPLTTVGGDEGLRGKPAPDIFLEVARRIGARPNRCIVFEDAPYGIEAARQAGMHAVGICSGHSAAELSGPHVLACVADYRELIAAQFLENLHVASL